MRTFKVEMKLYFSCDEKFFITVIKINIKYKNNLSTFTF